MFEHIDGGVKLFDARCGISLRRHGISNEVGQPINITVQAGPFHGTLLDKTVGSFDSFCDELQTIQATLNGSATLASYDGFEMTLVDNGCGAIRVDVNLVGDFYAPVRLTFGMDIDQSYLPAIISSVKNEFPVTS